MHLEAVAYMQVYAAAISLAVIAVSMLLLLTMIA